MRFNFSSGIYTILAFLIVLGVLALITVSIIALVKKEKDSKPSQLTSLKQEQNKIQDELAQLRLRVDAMEKGQRKVE